MKHKQPEKRNWKIYYTNYAGVEKRAVELVSREMGTFTVRDPGVYCVHVLAVEKLGGEITGNAVVIGTYESSPLFAKYIDRAQVQKNGCVVKVMDNPDVPDAQLVLLCGDTAAAVWYAAVLFVDDYMAYAAPVRGGLYMPEEVFMGKLRECCVSSAPKAKTRSVFTWGHPINDFRKCIETLARLKFNQIIVWNDYLPLNAEEFVDYAHSFGIEVIWGFAWGWLPQCDQTDISQLDEIRKNVVHTYKTVYKGKGDGIYFQSFTELNSETLQGKLIAEVVTDFVNETAAQLFEETPDLLLQFGLHANSVKKHAEHFKRLDPRVQIIWENCGVFPYSHDMNLTTESMAETLAFSDEVIMQRPGVPTGMVFKGLLKQDWPYFEHQAGPYILGNASPETIKKDMDMFTPMMRFLQSEWMLRGEFAHTLAKELVRCATGELHLCIASHIADTPWYPLALCAELLWDPNRSYRSVVAAVSRRRYVVMA